jgi:hypothetical protein
MNIIKATWIIGTFLGYALGRIFRLEDGSVWTQEGPNDEPCYRESPGCRLLQEHMGRVYLDVEGTSGVAWVEQGLKRRPHAGEY